MSNKTYDLIKNIALFATPVITFAAALCTIWNVSHCAEITATFAALDTLLGGIVVIAKKIHDKETE